MDDFKYRYIESPTLDDLNWYLASPCVIDCETTGLEHDSEIIDIVVGDLYGDGEIIMFPGKYAGLLDHFLPGFYPVGHNFKFDLHRLHKYAPCLLKTNWRDTMLMHHLLYEEKSHSLDDIIQERYNDPYKSIFWESYETYQEAPPNERARYACKDVYYTRKLHKELCSEITQRQIPTSLVTHVHRLARVLFETERTGLCIDLDYLVKMGGELKTQIEGLKPQMRKLVEVYVEALEIRYWLKELNKRKTDKGKQRVERPVFSFDSNRQLCDLLYGELKLPPQYSDKSKNVSVDDAALARLEASHPVIGLIREFRGHQKVYGTYIEGTLVRLRDGRIFPEFNVNGTVTGRISSSNPNMQNLPKEGGVRGIYVPDPGHVLVTADYGQLEVVLAAHFSGDKSLLKIILDGASMHDITAQALNIPRDVAKTINFASQYGCTHWKIQKILKISEEKALAVHAKYWEAYSGVKRCIDECSAKIDAGVPIVNPFGRQRLFEVKERSIYDQAYRQGFNSLVQGTGADMTSWALYSADVLLREKDCGKALFSVHDELVIQVKPEKYEESAEILRKTMSEAASIIGVTLPLKVEVSRPLTRWEK